MMAARLVSVGDQSLPDYPIGPDERLDGNSFVKWQTARWLASKTFKLMSWENQGMARALFDLCQNESPIGTLPDDDDELAYMLRCDARRIAEMRKLTFGPLRNWSRCRCGDEIRLMHPVVLAQVQDALERRELAKLSKEEKAIQMRVARLRKALIEEGLSDAIVSDDLLIGRIDDWLCNHKRGNRTKDTYRSAILYASRAGWLGGSGVGKY